MENAIEANNLYKKYGTLEALSNLSLTIPHGQAFGFLGPNGAGKTTFVKILLNLVSPDRGSSKIFGIPSSRSASRERIGFLPENMSAYQFLSVVEFLKFHVKLIGLSTVSSSKDIEHSLNITGMYKNKDKKMGDLSKGMRQRAGIAQALLGDPDLLVLDEPTSGLDPIGIKEIRDILLDLKGRGKTIFLNSHLLSEIEKTCDSIAILNKGKIIHTTDRYDSGSNEEYLEVKAQNISNVIIEKINNISIRNAELIEGLIKVYIGSKEESLKVHEIIIHNGGELLSLAWRGESLEDIFYRLVKEKEE